MNIAPPPDEKSGILVLGVGNILYSDEGVGVRVAEILMQEYDFPPNVKVMDGGTLGLNLLGVISEADHLIVVDAVKNGQPPGTFYRIEGKDIPERVRAKNSLHQIDLLEALTLCQAFDHVPETVILGVEPADIDTLCIELTPQIEGATPELTKMVLNELTSLGVVCQEKTEKERQSCVLPCQQK